MLLSMVSVFPTMKSETGKCHLSFIVARTEYHYKRFCKEADMSQQVYQDSMHKAAWRPTMPNAEIGLALTFEQASRWRCWLQIPYSAVPFIGPQIIQKSTYH